MHAINALKAEPSMIFRMSGIIVTRSNRSFFGSLFVRFVSFLSLSSFLIWFSLQFIGHISIRYKSIHNFAVISENGLNTNWTDISIAKPMDNSTCRFLTNRSSCVAFHYLHLNAIEIDSVLWSVPLSLSCALCGRQNWHDGNILFSSIAWLNVGHGKYDNCILAHTSFLHRMHVSIR